MRWVNKHNTVTPLLAWCLAAVFLFAQTLESAHSHDQHDSDEFASECEICIAGWQLDDIDLASVDPCYNGSSFLPAGFAGSDQITQIIPAYTNVRAPPVS